MTQTQTDKTKSALLVLFAAMFFTTLPTISQAQEERFNRTIDIGDDGELSLSNVSGDITIEGTSGTDLVINAVKRLHGRANNDLLEQVRIDVSQNGDRVRIVTRYPNDDDHDDDDDDRGRHRGRGGVSVDYRISLPRGTEVEVKSVSGDVRVENLDGETEARSVSGDVTVRQVKKLIEAKSVSGSVEVTGARGDEDVEIASVSGDVTVTDLEAEELDLTSVSGDVSIRQAYCENGEFDSVSGDIRYDGRIAPGGEYEFKSHSGEVLLILDGDVGFELEASTFSGDIETDFPLTLTSSKSRNRKIRGVVGDGSAVIEASTFSGDVVIRKR